MSDGGRASTSTKQACCLPHQPGGSGGAVRAGRANPSRRSRARSPPCGPSEWSSRTITSSSTPRDASTASTHAAMPSSSLRAGISTEIAGLLDGKSLGEVRAVRETGTSSTGRAAPGTAAQHRTQTQATGGSRSRLLRCAASCDGSNRSPRSHALNRRHQSYMPPTPAVPPSSVGELRRVAATSSRRSARRGFASVRLRCSAVHSLPDRARGAPRCAIGSPNRTSASGVRSFQNGYSSASGTTEPRRSRARDGRRPACSASGRSRTSVNRPWAVIQSTRLGSERIVVPDSEELGGPAKRSSYRRRRSRAARRTRTASPRRRRWPRSDRGPRIRSRQHDADHRIPPRRVVQHDEQRVVVAAGTGRSDSTAARRGSACGRSGGAVPAEAAKQPVPASRQTRSVASGGLGEAGRS